MVYKPDLPAGQVMPAGHRIDVEHPLYKAFHADAETKGLSQEAFSEALGAYVRGVTGRSAPAPAPSPTAAPKPAPVSFEKLPVSQQFARALERTAAKRG